jgi:enoyl-CoA hydratase/carnithine racemase
MSPVVLQERRGAVGWVTINRPERRNALNQEVAEGIAAAIAALEADSACRAIVLTGAGEAFCAGGDLQADSSGTPFTTDPADGRHFVAGLLRRMEACRLPLIARVNGHAMAGGLGLVCACDLAVAASEARFGTPETRVGLFPMLILPFMLRVLPARKLMELCLTGEPVAAEEALAMGLVNYVVPASELDAKLDWLIGRIGERSPTAVRLGKMGLRALRDMTLEQALEYAQLMLPAMARTRDAAEGFAAFRDKRPPSWTGQ